MSKEKVIAEFLDQENAQTIVDLIADPETQEPLRIKLIKRIVETKHSDNFFQAMLEHKMTFGSCPKCGHENNWLIPEEEQAKMGWVSHEKDPRVPVFTDSKSCPKFSQACKKKKITV